MGLDNGGIEDLFRYQTRYLGIIYIYTRSSNSTKPFTFRLFEVNVM